MPLFGRGRFGETRFGGASRFIDVAGLAGGEGAVSGATFLLASVQGPAQGYGQVTGSAYRTGVLVSLLSAAAGDGDAIAQAVLALAAAGLIGGDGDVAASLSIRHSLAGLAQGDGDARGSLAFAGLPPPSQAAIRVARWLRRPGAA